MESLEKLPVKKTNKNKQKNNMMLMRLVIACQHAMHAERNIVMANLSVCLTSVHLSVQWAEPLRPQLLGHPIFEHTV